MDRARLGNSNLAVSRMCLGTWAWGGGKWWGSQDDEDSAAAFFYSLSQDINFVDTAPIYGFGRAEEVLGRLLPKVREKIVLATKAGLKWQSKKIIIDLSAANIKEEFELSCRRLNTDYIDLYQAHWPDKNTPLAQTAEAMYKLFQKGKIKAVGVSNFSRAQMEEFMKYCPLHSLQPPYNMWRREIETEIIPFCQEHNIAIISYSPLESGILSGKFFFEKVTPSDLNRKNNKNLKPPFSEINKKCLLRLKEISDSYNISLAQLALAWVLKQKAITAPIFGARTKMQAKENIAAYNLKLKTEDWNKVEEILSQRALEIKNL